MSFENLKSMSRDELVILACKQGLPKPHHKSSVDTIIKNILDSVQPKQEQPEQVAETPVVTYRTQEEIEKAVAHIKAARPNFRTEYTDHTVKFVCGEGRRVAEETVNLSVPLRVMLMIAEQIKYGPRALRAYNNVGFESGNAQGINAYTNVVLA